MQNEEFSYRHGLTVCWSTLLELAKEVVLGFRLVEVANKVLGFRLVGVANEAPVELEAPGYRLMELEAPGYRLVELEAPGSRFVELEAPGIQT